MLKVLIVYSRDPLTGKITNYKTYEQNSKNPTGYDEILGYDGVDIKIQLQAKI